jgi:hypothetical protein
MVHMTKMNASLLAGMFDLGGGQYIGRRHSKLEHVHRVLDRSDSMVLREARERQHRQGRKVGRFLDALVHDAYWEALKEQTQLPTGWRDQLRVLLPYMKANPNLTLAEAAKLYERDHPECWR